MRSSKCYMLFEKRCSTRPLEEIGTNYRTVRGYIVGLGKSVNRGITYNARYMRDKGYFECNASFYGGVHKYKLPFSDEAYVALGTGDVLVLTRERGELFA